jgi:autotransporter translocation and assembly factor TamB
MIIKAIRTSVRLITVGCLALLLLILYSPIAPYALLYYVPEVHVDNLSGRIGLHLTMAHVTWHNLNIEKVLIRRTSALSWHLTGYKLRSDRTQPIQLDADVSLWPSWQVKGSLDRLPFDWLEHTTLQANHPNFYWTKQQFRLALPQTEALQGSLIWQQNVADMTLHQGEDKITLHFDPDKESFFEIKVDCLKALFPMTHGFIQGHIRLLKQKLLSSDLTIHDLKWQEWSIADAKLLSQCKELCHGELSANLSQTPMATPMHAWLSFIEDKSRQYHWQQTLSGSGWQLLASGLADSGILQIKDLQAHMHQAVWQLTSPATVIISPSLKTQSPLCLAHTTKKLCFQKQLHPSMTFTKVPLEMFDAVLTFFSLPITQLHGEVNGNIAWHGSYWPQGLLIIQNMGFHLPKLGTNWSNGTLNLTTSGKTVNYYGHLMSNQTPLSFQGQWSLTPPWRGLHHLEGKNIPLFDLPHAKLKGDLSLALETSHEHHQISGHAHFTTGSIQRPDFSATVALPSNTILMNQGETISSSQHLPIAGNIDLESHDHVTLEMMGIQGQLSGQIRIHLNPDFPITATGQCTLINPTYPAISAVKVKQAVIGYDHSLLTNPNLNIELTREADVMTQIDFDHPQTVLDPLTVSLHIGGTAHTPQYHIRASNPDLGQSEVLSALLSGEASINALTGLSMASNLNTNPLLEHRLNPIGRIRKLLDLEEISLSMGSNDTSDSSDNLSHPSIVLRKILSKKSAIYSKFGIDSDTYTMSLLYSLTPTLTNQIYLNQRGYGTQLLYRWNSK